MKIEIIVEITYQQWFSSFFLKINENLIYLRENICEKFMFVEIIRNILWYFHELKFYRLSLISIFLLITFPNQLLYLNNIKSMFCINKFLHLTIELAMLMYRCYYCLLIYVFIQHRIYVFHQFQSFSDAV